MFNLNIALGSINMAKDNLNKMFIESGFHTILIEDINFVSGFYDVEREKADKLTLDDEYVGNAYYNLQFIEPYAKIKSKKL